MRAFQPCSPPGKITDYAYTYARAATSESTQRPFCCHRRISNPSISGTAGTRVHPQVMNYGKSWSLTVWVSSHLETPQKAGEWEHALGNKEHSLGCHNCQPGKDLAAHQQPPCHQETVFTARPQHLSRKTASSPRANVLTAFTEAFSD